MKRRILLVAICYIIGTIGGLYLNKNIILFLCVLLFLVVIKVKTKYSKIIAIAFIISSLMSIVKLSYVEKFYNYKDEVAITGIVCDVSDTQYYKKILLEVNSINGNKIKPRSKVYIYLKNYNSGIVPGNYIRTRGKISYIQESRNYKGFNYRNYLKSKQIYGIIKTDEIELVSVNKFSFYQKFVTKARNYIRSIMNKHLSASNAEICRALILGEKEDVDKNIIKNFSEGGLSHILAISGMHVAYVATIAAFMAKKTFGKRKGYYFIILTLIFFCNLAHNCESVFRATTMLILYYIAKLLHRKSDSITNLAISTILSLIINPFSIYSVSFIMSSVGALGIIIFYRYVGKLNCKNKVISYIKNQISLGLSANLILIPIVMLYFNKLSLIFFLSSSIINFIISFLMPAIILLIVCGFFTDNLSIIVSKIVTLLTELLLKLGELFSGFKVLNFLTNTPSVCSVVGYYVLLIFLYEKLKYGYLSKKSKSTIKCVLIGYLIVCVLSSLFYYSDRNMNVYFIDVGQGDATLVVTPSKKKILIDGGGSEMGEDSVGENILLPYLLDRKIKSLDYVFFSHFDSDHCRWFIYCIK